MSSTPAEPQITNTTQTTSTTSGWYKSSFSGDGGCCVEICITSDGVKVRDSKDVRAGVAEPLTLGFTTAEWRAFIDGVKAGEFDL